MDNSELEIFHPLRIRTLDGHRSIVIIQGLTGREIVERYVEPELRELVVVLNNGTEIKDLDGFRSKNGDNLLIVIVAGKDNWFSAVLSIAVAAFAWYVTPLFFGAAAGSGLAGLGLAGALVSAGISFVGNMLIGALIPPPSIGNTKSSGATSTATISGQSNQLAIYSPVIKVYGRYKVFPTLAANPIIENVGITSRIDMLYDFGYGDCEITDIKIGDTPAAQFNPSFNLHRNSYVTDLAYVTRKVGYDQFQYTLSQNSVITINTKQSAVGAEVSINFPEGLCWFSSRKNNQHENVVTLRGRYRLASGGAWTPITNWRGMQRAELQKSGGSAGSPATIAYGGKQYKCVTKIPANTQAGIVAYISGRAFNTYVNAVTVQSGTEFWETTTTYTYYMVMAATLIQGNPAYAGDWGATFTTPEVPAVAATYTGVVDIWHNTTQPFVAVGTMYFPTSDIYQVEIFRYSAVDSDPKVKDLTTLTLLKSIQKGSVVALKKRHTMLEMRVMASDKLTGVVQNLSAIATSVLRTTTDGITFTSKATSNPAWIALDILTGEANPRPLLDAQIDWASWITLANYCDEPYTVVVNGETITKPRYTTNFVVDYKTTVQELIQSVLSAARATISTTTAGKYGVVIDRLQSTPRQLITPSNSWGFSGSRSFSDTPHALKVSYIEPDINWQKTEFIVYWDGYNVNNATQFDNLSTFGITNYSDAWRYGRYMMAQGISRSELFSITLDIENLVVQRGDLVYVAHDVPMIGGQAGRIMSIVGLDVVMDMHLSAAPNSYTFRMADGTVKSGAITASLSDNTFTFDNVTGLQVDDLGVIGISNTVTNPYLVQQITPSNDLTAELLLVAYVPDVYDADQGALPDWNPKFSQDLINTSDLEVYNLTGSATLIYRDRYPFSEVYLSWNIIGSFYHKTLIYLIRDTLPDLLIGETSETNFEFEIDVRSEFDKLGDMLFTLVPVNATGFQGTSQSITLTIAADTTPPLAAEFFDLDLKRETITLSWQHPDEQDIDYYEIRYCPAVINGLYSNSTIVIASVPYPTRSFDCPARLGTYFIKTIDTSGNRSDDYAATYTPSESILGLNSIEVVDDRGDGWIGSKFEFISIPSTALQGAFSSDFSSGFFIGDATNGYLKSVEYSPNIYPQRAEYYYDAVYDGGDIYLTRFTSKINSGTFNENSFMVAWSPMSIADPIEGWYDSTATGIGSISDSVNVWHEVRWAETSMTMVDWNPMSNANPIGFGSASFGEWRMFQVGDYTGRVFQFRLIAEYVGGNFTPDAGVIITDAVIEVDMPDRVDGEYDLIASAGGSRFSYLPPFKKRPALGITCDNVQIGDNYVISNQDQNGFDIEFKDSNGNSVSRQFDWIAKGYGAKSTRIISGLSRKGARRI